MNLDFQAESRLGRPEAPRRAALEAPHSDFHHEVERLIMSRFAPAAVVITSDLHVVHVSGQTGRYLQPAPGEASLHLLKMAREGLILELRTAIHAARKTNAPVRKERIRVRQNGTTGEVDLEVVPIQVMVGERHLLVLFRDSTPIPVPTGRRGAAAPRRLEPQIRHLRDELHSTREYLQAIIQDQEATNEELQSANEEILSSNEELQSTNEELETAKEELQSTNEELNTVNDELQTRNHELGQVNSDLTNLLASVQIPIIMVSNDLRIRRFTPMIEQIFNIIPSDAGRPIRDFKANLNLPDLDRLITETIDTVSVREIEAQDLQGRWYSIRIRPYKGMDHRIDGAVVTLQDIDAIKRSVSLNMVSDHMLTAMAEITHDPLVVLDAAHRVRTASRAFYRAFRVSPQEARDRTIFEVHRGQWDESRLRTLLGELLTRDQRVEDFEIARASASGPGWTVNAIAIGGPEDASRTILLGFASLQDSRGERN
jgi:two-component system CheB/CheR fusion protein